jgi:hypothetical protein
MHSSAWLDRSPPPGLVLCFSSVLRELCWQYCFPATARTSPPAPLLCWIPAGKLELGWQTRQDQTQIWGLLSRAVVRLRSRWVGAGAWWPCLSGAGLSRAGWWWYRPTCKSHQGMRRRVGRLHSGARKCHRVGPATWSAACSRRTGMHNYALDQTLPCCYGTIFLIARAQGLARFKAAASALRQDEHAQSVRDRR